MLFALPDHDTLYRALLRRDVSFEGRAFVAVTTTGIFCRLTCPARKPKQAHCRFFETAGACLAAGFRPCKRCHPLGAAADADPMVAMLLEALEARPGHRWREGDISAMGLDLSTVRRSFKRQFGMTFLEMARQRRLAAGFEVLAGGGRVIEAQIDAGFESASAFRAAFARLLGVAPGSRRRNPRLAADWIETPLGPMIAVSDREALHLLEFISRKALPGELQRLAKMVRGDMGIGRRAPVDQVAGELAAFFAGRCARSRRARPAVTASWPPHSAGPAPPAPLPGQMAQISWP